MRKIAYIHNPETNRHFVILFSLKIEDINPYRIYEIYWNEKRHAKSQKLLVKYADFNSCLCFIKEELSTKYN